MTVRRPLLVFDLGRMPYGDALVLQREVAHARIDGRLVDDALLLVEHPPVITLGRGTHAANLLTPVDVLASRGVETFDVERGGDVTFHGPGQLVGYPILDLRQHRQDLHWYLRQVEEALIRAIATYGLVGERQPGYTGVWTRGVGPTPPSSREGAGGPAAGSGDAGRGTVTPAARKIASIGVHAKQWVTWHGFALNVSTDLSFFDLIVPCGIEGVEMTSVSRELSCSAPPLDHVARTVAAEFAGTFGREERWMTGATLMSEARVRPPS